MSHEFLHLDTFSGLGGWAIAARATGFKTVAFCESDVRCVEFLSKTWGLPVEPDIRTLDGKKYRGITLLTSSPPCQPSSRAGDQRGEEDDRWLWDEALRVLAESEPDCVVFENPPGILDVGIDGILSEMARLGYETQCFDIPACAVDSPQLRHRIWIVGFLEDTHRRRFRTGTRIEHAPDVTSCRDGGVADAELPGSGQIPETTSFGQRASEPERYHLCDLANTSSARHEERRMQRGLSSGKKSSDSRETTHMGSENNMANTERKRREWRPTTPGQTQAGRAQPAVDGLLSDWRNFVWVPCADGKFRRSPDDSVGVVDGLHRSVLGALGNSIVPQVAVEILKGVKQVLVK